jgi:hypothetical protein
MRIQEDKMLTGTATTDGDVSTAEFFPDEYEYCTSTCTGIIPRLTGEPDPPVRNAGRCRSLRGE